MQVRDQAYGLRLIANKNVSKKLVSNKPNARVIAVTSGKGGVGKTNLTINLALALKRLGKRVMVIDADLGLANIDVLIGLTPKYNLKHVIHGDCTMEEVIVNGPEGVLIIPGASGITELADLSDSRRELIIDSFSRINDLSDIILIDTGAGVSRNVRRFVTASNEAIVVTSPDPTAVTDAYSMIKIIVQENDNLNIKLVVNMALSKDEAEEISDRIALVVKRFLNKDIQTLGHILMDKSLQRAVRNQEPVLINDPASSTSRSINLIARKLGNMETFLRNNHGGFRSFLARLIGG